MPRANDAVEAMLIEYADLLSILFDDPYKPRAYEKAARAVGGYPVDLEGKDMPEILKVPSVGRSIGEKIEEFLTTGTMAELEALREKIPAGVRDMMSIPGLGPKKAMVLYRELGVGSVDELVAAIEQDRVAALPRFGAKTQENIARGIGQLQAAGGRVKIDVALERGRGLHRRPVVAAAGPSRGLRGLAPADEGDDRRRGPPRGRVRRSARHGGVRRPTRRCPACSRTATRSPRS